MAYKNTRKSDAFIRKLLSRRTSGKKTPPNGDLGPSLRLKEKLGHSDYTEYRFIVEAGKRSRHATIERGKGKLMKGNNCVVA